MRKNRYPKRFLSVRSFAVRNFRINGNSCIQHLGSGFSAKPYGQKPCRKTASWKRAFRQYITVDASKTLVNSLVTSRLDYANVLLCGTNNYTLGKLQRVKDTAARLVTGTKKREHITPVLQSLHWLPVTHRVQYKILLYAFKIRHGLAPVYMNNMISTYCPPRSLRSESANLLSIPLTKTATYGNKRYDKCAATLWNSLPVAIRRIDQLTAFKKALKTHLFRMAYQLS